MTPRFKISAGNLPQLNDTLQVCGVPVNLTGCTVQFVFQLAPAGTSTTGVPTIPDAPNGKLSYQFTAGQTDAVGMYRGQWVVTNGAVVTSYPPCPFEFEILPGLPTQPETGFTKLSQLCDDVRAVTGDFKKRMYEDRAIMSVMRTQLRLGRVKSEWRHCHGQPMRWGLAPDGMTLVPPILPTDILAYSLLVYHTADTLIAPNLAAYSYRTRALSERFGEQKDFHADIKNLLYDLENGEQTYGTITGLRASVFAVNGIWAWAFEYAVNSIELSFL